jgi:cyanate permease
MVGFVANLVGSFALSFAIITTLTLIQTGIGFYAGRPGIIPAK